MKKISIILSAALLMGSTLLNTSCEFGEEVDDIYGPSNNHNHNNGGDGPEEDAPGVIEDFTVTLDYTASGNSLSGFDADTKRVVSISDASADLVTCWQASYGDIVSQPAGGYIKELLSYNNINYTNSNTCTIQNLGKVNMRDYADKITMSELSPKPGSIANIKGQNQVMVEPGDVLAFKTNKGTVGVAKVSGISKFSRKMTLTGYVYYPGAAR